MERETSKLSMASGLLALVGLVFVVAGWLSVRSATAVASWPVVEGRIVSARVISQDREKQNAATGRRELHTRYFAEVSYLYTAEGAEHVGSRVSVTDLGHLEESDAAQVVERYPVGAPVGVHYDPKSPESAVLEVELSSASYAPMGLGAILLLVALGMRFAARAGSQGVC